jgi:hypothetical protein
LCVLFLVYPIIQEIHAKVAKSKKKFFFTLQVQVIDALFYSRSKLQSIIISVNSSFLKGFTLFLRLHWLFNFCISWKMINQNQLILEVPHAARPPETGRYVKLGWSSPNTYTFLYYTYILDNKKSKTFYGDKFKIQIFC